MSDTLMNPNPSTHPDGVRAPSRLGSRLLRSLVVMGAVAGAMAPRSASALKQGYCPGLCTTTPGIKYTGSAAPSFEVVPVFWGSHWTTPSFPTRGQIVGVIQSLVNGPYFGALPQYANSEFGMAPARMAPLAPIDTSSVPEPVGESDLEHEVNVLIGQGVVPPPSLGSEHMPVYLVFIPPDWSNSIPAGAGENWWGTCDGTCGSAYVNARYRIAVSIPKASAMDTSYGPISHELVEAMTPNVTITNCPGVGQIADLCECWDEPALQNTTRVGAYWSAADAACVIPESYSTVYQYNDAVMTWTQVGSGVRQIQAGGYGLFATDTNDGIMRYSGSPGTWYVLPGTVSMFSVGASWLMALSEDTSAIFRYTTGSGWSWVPGAASAVYSGAFDLAADYNGYVWEYIPTSNSWSFVSFPTDQIVVGDTWAGGIVLDRSTVNILPGGPGASWIPTQHPATELFAGGHMALAARPPQSFQPLFAMTTSYVGGNLQLNGWNGMGFVDGVTFALYGSSGATLAATDPSGNVWVDTSPIGSPPSWSQIPSPLGAPVTRVVGGGAYLYATGAISYQ
jgi:hypothetical protein